MRPFFRMEGYPTIGTEGTFWGTLRRPTVVEITRFPLSEERHGLEEEPTCPRGDTRMEESPDPSVDWDYDV